MQRGLQVLWAFVGGVADLSNAELAQRTGLPRPTISRLTRSLVDAGFLEYDVEKSVYRLAPVCLSLAAAYRLSHGYIAVAHPLVVEAANELKVNLSLVTISDLHLLYVDGIRAAPGPVRRIIESGFRAPVDQFVSGRAVIAAMSEAARNDLFDRLAIAYGEQWASAHRTILRSMRQFARLGYCSGPSIPGLHAVATAFTAPDGNVFGLVMTYPESAKGGLSLSEASSAVMRVAAEIGAIWRQLA